jgi:microcystin-dependent protein
MALKNGRTSVSNQTILLGTIIPTGTVQSFAGGQIPSGWLLCDGQTVPRSTYSGLFDIIGTRHGQGDGSTTFHLPDLRGRFIRGADNMGSGAAGRDPSNSSRSIPNTGGATARTRNTTVLSENWESGNFTQNGWTVVNGSQTNKFIVGTSTKNSGSYSAYISNDNSNNTYTTNSASVVWFYKDVVIPAGQVDFSFNYKLRGETVFDYLRVIIDPNLTIVPIAGTAISSTPSGGSNTILSDTSNTWSNRTVSLDSYQNTTIRIIFGWANDILTGTQPPVAIDDIEIYTVDSIGTTQTDAVQGHYHGNGRAAGGFTSNTDQAAMLVSGSVASNSSATSTANKTVLQTNGTHGTPRQDSETRPNNLACMYIIKV